MSFTFRNRSDIIKNQRNRVVMLFFLLSCIGDIAIAPSCT